MAKKKWSRRKFLLTALAGVSASFIGCRGGDGVIKDQSAPTPTADPAMTPTPTTLDGIPITPVGDFFVEQMSSTPQIDAESWTLTIDGLVENPLTLTYRDILALPPSDPEMWVVACVGNPVGGGLIGNATWRGAQLAQLLERAGIQPEAKSVRVAGADGFEESLSLTQVNDPRTLLAYEMNGEPLTPDHGFPLRIMVPNLYGMKLPKWLTRIEFIDYEFIGFWGARGWTKTAWVKTFSQFTYPRSGFDVTGPITLEGFAFAGDEAITAVEIQINDSEWMPAEIVEPPTPLAWTPWQLEWTPPESGQYTLRVRATDETGFTQHEGPDTRTSGYPDGADGIHKIVVFVELA
jgi:DMSO/TMAO reductase YedYZ molybdopterin-dependent catalytic subunit